MSQCGQLYHQNTSWSQSFLIFSPCSPPPSSLYLLLPGFLQSLPIRTHCFCCRPSKCWSHLAARDASDKHKAAQASPGLRTLQWLPITLRPKSDLLTVASQDTGDLTAAHWSDFIVNVLFSTQVTPLRPLATPWKSQAPFLLRVLTQLFPMWKTLLLLICIWFTTSFYSMFLLKRDLRSHKE